MFVKNFCLLASNPFFDAYIHSDFLGKLIFIGLIALSIITWILIVHKFLQLKAAQKNALKFYKEMPQKTHLLTFDYQVTPHEKKSNPFFQMYQLFKKQTIDVLNKNRKFGEEGKETAFLSSADMAIIESQMQTAITSEISSLEKNLYILSTIVSLAPFLGLLGTVWGILTTFSELQSMTSGSTHQMVLGGLSLALATTVIGLIDAIPAMIGYNYFKNAIRDFEMEMEGFSTEILTSLEMNYRRVDAVYG